jgi:exosome complex component RRP42
VKLEVDEPFPDTPDKGIFIVSLEFLPSSFPTVEPGPPSSEAIEIARIVDKTLRESGFIKLNEMVIEEGKYVWLAFIDIYVINDDGNIVDASMLATLGALLTTRFPELKKVGEGYAVDPKVKTDKALPLDLDRLPTLISFAKVGGKYILDPIKLEEESAELLIHVGLSDHAIHGLQTRKAGTISQEDFLTVIDSAQALHKKVKKLLLNSIK